MTRPPRGDAPLVEIRFAYSRADLGCACEIVIPWTPESARKVVALPGVSKALLPDVAMLHGATVVVRSVET